MVKRELYAVSQRHTSNVRTEKSDIKSRERRTNCKKAGIPILKSGKI